MARGRDRLLVLLAALAIGGAYAAVRYRVMAIVLVMLAALGLYGTASGARMIVTRRARVATGGVGASQRAEQHTGLSAQIWGALFVMMGAVILIVTYAMWRYPSGSPELHELFAAALRSGVLAVIAGAAIGMYGMTRLVADRTAFAELHLPQAEHYFRGVLFSAIGLVLVTIGFLSFVAPNALSAFGAWIGTLISSHL
jgi:magnesium-transporting ATPase (P-type)